MKKKERTSFPIHCNVMLLAHDCITREITDIKATHNLIKTSGKVLVARMLMEDTGWNTGITYCALGNDATTPVVGAPNTLTAEQARKAITAYVRSTNIVEYETYFLASECTFYVREVGLFGHSTASAAANSGEMFNHALITYDNTLGLKDLTIVVQITFG